MLMLDCPTDMAVKALGTFTTKTKFTPMFGPEKCAMWTESVMRPGVP